MDQTLFLTTTGVESSLEYLKNLKFEDEFEGYLLSDCLPPAVKSIYSLTTPTNVPLTISSIDNIELFISAIIRNFLICKSMTTVSNWTIIFSQMKQYATADRMTCIAGLSFILACSKLPSFQGVTFKFEVDSVMVLPDNCPVSNLLQTDKVLECWKTIKSKGTGGSDYIIPPTIIVVDCSDPNIMGWVCTDNYIAIDKSLVKMETALEVITLFNIVGHQSAHGLLRQVLDDFNIHSPYMCDCVNANAGELFETIVWRGLCPRWHSPIDTNRANLLANKVLVRFENTGELMEVKADDIMKYVGCRPDACHGGFMMCHTNAFLF